MPCAVAPVSPFAVSNQHLNAVPAQWQTFDQAPAQASGIPSAAWQQHQHGQVPTQLSWQQQQQQLPGHFQHQQAWGQGQSYDSPSLREEQGMQAPVQQQGLWQEQNQQVAPWQDQQQPTWGQGPGQGPVHCQHDSQWHIQGQQPTPWQHQSQLQPMNNQSQLQQQSVWQEQHPEQHPDQFAALQGETTQQLQDQQFGDAAWLQIQRQGSAVQPSVGPLQSAPSGVRLEHRTKTMRTTSFRQVIRSASEGDALSMQAEPANSLQVTWLHCCDSASHACPLMPVNIAF